MPVTGLLQAGLGNQLFIYGATLALARRLGVEFTLDTSLFRFDVRRDFELGFFDTGSNKVTGKYVQRRESRSESLRLPAKVAQYLTIRRLAKDPKVLMENSKTYDLRFERATDGTKLLGYFQSWRYLETVASEIRERVLTATLLDDESRVWVESQKRMIAKLRNPTVVHVRRGDYLLPAHRDFHGLLGREYYQEALTRVADIAPIGSVLVVSDDISAARQVLNFIGDDDVVYLEQPTSLPDSATLLAVSGLQNYVIANSSFSWWWAWLSQAPNVIAPQRWFAREDLDSSDVCPKHWHLV